MMMNSDHNRPDPLDLSALPLLEPDRDGWPEIRQALETHARLSHRRRQAVGWLAAAATLVLAIGIATYRSGVEQESTPALALESSATPDRPVASTGHEDTVQELIAMSQTLEQRLRDLREGSTALPAQSAVYIAELEDMIARVDGELSLNPESLDLWGQRVNLLLDLELIFQHQWEREYGRMAAL